MPVKIDLNLPAVKALEKENIFFMSQERALAQDIRPLKVAILNLMPTKEVTENQLLRLISNSPLQVDVVLMHTVSYESKNTSQNYLKSFYKTFDDIKDEMFDGLVITGAPVENMNFEEVSYWDELTRILQWAETNVYSTMYICWAAQAGLYHRFGINKRRMAAKLSGVYTHKVVDKLNPITRGFDGEFFAPHSRFTTVERSELENVPGLNILCESEEAGVYMAVTDDLRHLFVTGHSEYDEETLHYEYLRDKERGMDIEPPKNYYQNGEVGKINRINWRAHSTLLFNNWLNYAVYQQTPYDLNDLRVKR